MPMPIKNPCCVISFYHSRDFFQSFLLLAKQIYNSACLRCSLIPYPVPYFRIFCARHTYLSLPFFPVHWNKFFPVCLFYFFSFFTEKGRVHQPCSWFVVIYFNPEITIILSVTVSPNFSPSSFSNKPASTKAMV